MTPSHDLSARIPSTADARRSRADEADTLLAGLLEDAAGPDAAGLAVVAVGGYGRRELSPSSDLDVVLLHHPDVADERVPEVASALWYPLWDRGVALDHAVRDTVSMREAAVGDHRAALGMLDARAVAGEADLVATLRSQVLADWRRDARRRVPELRASREQRIERAGWVAHSAVPDLKDAGGGLRDAVVLRGLVATWLVEVPHAEAEALRSALLDVRDALHVATGRRTDRLLLEVVPDVAAVLDVDPEALDLHVRQLGRRHAHLSGLAWARVERALAPPTRRPVAPMVSTLADGVGRSGEDVVLLAGADPARDPEVGLRLAEVAARAGLPVGTSSARRLGATTSAPPEPWSPTARRSLVGLLGSGAGLVRVWDELDLAGVVDHWLPEWSTIRLRGSSSPVHRFTIDRHCVEACVQAAALQRDVERPDLLLVAALLHDLGKGLPGDHSVVGEPLAEQVALRWGFDAADARVVARLVRWHLLLPSVAVRRDIEDPSTVETVAEHVEDESFLDLLLALTIADALATSATAWTGWRRGLVEQLVAAVRAHLGGRAAPVDPVDYEGLPAGESFPVVDLPSGAEGRGAVHLDVEPSPSGSRLLVVARDRPGLIAEVAGGLALQGLTVRSVRAAAQGDLAASWWEVTRPDVDAAAVRERLRPVLAGEVDLASRVLRPPAADLPARVEVLEGRSASATVLQVRAADRRGLVWSVADVIASAGCSIRSAHLSTYGDEVRDVFYVVDEHGGPLEGSAARALRGAVADALA